MRFRRGGLMVDYKSLVQSTKEVGVVSQVMRSVVYVSGLPGAKPYELLVTEHGALCQVVALTDIELEVLVLSTVGINVGDEVARSGMLVEVPVGKELLGQLVNPLGDPVFGGGKHIRAKKRQPVDKPPPGIDVRKDIDTFFETGVAVVDLTVPMGVGQRELVVGDRKIGKTTLLKQSMVSHAKRGGVTVYAAIAKRQSEIKSLGEYVKATGVADKTVVVASSSADAPGLIFLTPYAAMSIAEEFRDQGLDVLIILDDLTIHAKYYREITLLAKRFPGRSAYPGDIFYVHSRLLERAGNYQKGSITALPVAETVLGDISGYIQTNLMSMTDGHIFFDQELYNQGRRPAVNPFLSVTRVGHQAQTAFYKSLSRELSSFLVHHEKMKQFMHFGGELSDQVKASLSLGDKVLNLFDQANEEVIPVSLAGVMLACLWAGMFKDDQIGAFRQRVRYYLEQYHKDERVKQYFEGLTVSAQSFAQLIEIVKKQPEYFENSASSK